MTHLSLGILILVFGVSLFWRRRSFWFYISKYVFYASPILVFSLLLYKALIEYGLWSQSEISKFLLPPYRDINYFVLYAGFRFFAPSVISLILAILFLYSAKALNRKYEERFFYLEEPYLGALAIFLVSHPGWIFYSIFIILIYLLIHIYSLLITYHLLRRLSLYYLWLPTAIFVIIIDNWWLQSLPFWQILKI